MADKFKPGEIVRLRSGGPDMTVERVVQTSEGTTYFCSWFAGAKDNSRGFKEAALESANDDS